MRIARSHPSIGSIDMTQGDRWRKVLTPREREVALLVVRGLSNKEVARKLGITTGTVKQHLHSVFQKLRAKNRHAMSVQARFKHAAE
jgi:DNA-binding CsgD family transcriptional regulator